MSNAPIVELNLENIHYYSTFNNQTKGEKENRMENTFDNCNSISCESKIMCQKQKLIKCVVFVVRLRVC